MPTINVHTGMRIFTQDRLQKCPAIPLMHISHNHSTWRQLYWYKYGLYAYWSSKLVFFHKLVNMKVQTFIVIMALGSRGFLLFNLIKWYTGKWACIKNAVACVSNYLAAQQVKSFLVVLLASLCVRWARTPRCSSSVSQCFSPTSPKLASTPVSSSISDR